MDSTTANRTRPRIRIGQLDVDAVTLPEAIDAIVALVEAGKGGAVFTPNVDHVCVAEHSSKLREAYARADLSLADGMPLVWTSRAFGGKLPERVAGSDITEPLLLAAQKHGYRVFFLGAAPGVAQRAAERLRERMPKLNIVGTLSPNINLDKPETWRAHVIETLKAVDPQLVIVALGAPKQELLIHSIRDELVPAVFLGLGAVLDFEAGVVPRAPKWVARTGMEWAYRLLREPGRLYKRYLLRDPEFALIVARAMLRRGKSASQ